jgi:hypothetical protein
MELLLRVPIGKKGVKLQNNGKLVDGKADVSIQSYEQNSGGQLMPSIPMYMTSHQLATLKH